MMKWNILGKKLPRIECVTFQSTFYILNQLKGPDSFLIMPKFIRGGGTYIFEEFIKVRKKKVELAIYRVHNF